jgi:hypothetical protein
MSQLAPAQEIETEGSQLQASPCNKLLRLYFKYKPSVVIHAFTPSYSGGRGRRIWSKASQAKV